RMSLFVVDIRGHGAVLLAVGLQSQAQLEQVIEALAPIIGTQCYCWLQGEKESGQQQVLRQPALASHGCKPPRMGSKSPVPDARPKHARCRRLAVGGFANDQAASTAPDPPRRLTPALPAPTGGLPGNATARATALAGNRSVRSNRRGSARTECW